jgi:hypothetical protein
MTLIRHLSANIDKMFDRTREVNIDLVNTTTSEPTNDGTTGSDAKSLTASSFEFDIVTKHTSPIQNVNSAVVA